MPTSIESTAPALAFTVPEFCMRHHIGRWTLEKLWREGKGPKRFQVGNGRTSKILISHESAAEWRRRMEGGEQLELFA